MSEKLNRLYGGISDSKMLDEAKTIKTLLTNNIGDFTAFDADLAQAPTALLNAITDAENVDTDETVTDLIQQTTATMNEKWELCRNKFQDSKYFIEKVFPKNKNVWNEFGYDDYDDMSTKQDKVLGFMLQFSKAANKYSTELIAADYTQAKIDEILTLRTAFEKANGDQNEAIKERGTLTQERIKLYNKVWHILQRISKASKSIYRNNAAKLQIFLLPGPGNNPREDLALIGIVKNTATNLPEENTLVSLPDLNLSSTTDEKGQYAFAASTPAGTHTITAAKTGFATTTDTATINDDGSLAEKDLGITPA